MLYLLLSRFGNVRPGDDNERPEFSDFMPGPKDFGRRLEAARATENGVAHVQ